MLRGERERDLVDHVVGGDELHHVAHDLVRDAHGAEERIDVAGPAFLADLDHLDVGDVARLRVVVGVGIVHDRDARHQVQLVDQVLVALVQVHGAGMQRRVRAMLVGRAEQLTRLADDDRVDVPGPGADVDRAVRGLPPAIVPGLPAPHQFFALDHAIDRPSDVGHVPEERELLLTDRQLARRASQVRFQHVRVRRVDHGRLGRLVEQVLGMVHEVLVERIVLRHQHREGVPVPAPGSPGLLPHGGARARVAGQHGGVERADVDAELEGVRRRDREQLAVGQLPLELPTILGQVAGSVRLDPRALLRVAHVATRELGQQLRGSSRPGEADGADVVLDQP